MERCLPLKFDFGLDAVLSRNLFAQQDTDTSDVLENETTSQNNDS